MNMKKVLCAMLAGATVLSMSAVSVFAQWAYDGDGEVTNDVPNQCSWGGLGASSSFTLDRFVLVPRSIFRCFPR